MKTLRYMTIVLAALALLFSVNVLTVAAADANTAPAQAAYIDSQSHTIAANSALWYRFDYAGDLSQILITLPNGNASGLAFDVFTPTQVGDWWETAPVGRGNPHGDDLIWSGNFNMPGTYYVEVINNTSSGMGFSMSIASTGVSLGAATGQAGRGGAGVPAPAPALNYTPTGGPVMNTDPGHAAMMDNKAHTIAANTALWYTFNYAGDKSLITIVLPNGNVSGVQFNVWTAQGASDWWDLQPVGRGTAQSIDCTSGEPKDNTGCWSNDLNWNGKFDLSGTYYVQVINTNSTPMSAQLQIQGDGVALSQ